METAPQVDPYHSPSWVHTAIFVGVELRSSDMYTALSKHAFDFFDAFIHLLHPVASEHAYLSVSLPKSEPSKAPLGLNAVMLAT